MKSIKEFFESVKNEESAVLATSDGTTVTMRQVSPVFCEDGVLIFTSPQSVKYGQLKANPNCCLFVGGAFLQAKAVFSGATMVAENAVLRAVYDEKFPGAFEDDTVFGGMHADFIMLKPLRLTGWNFESGAPVPFCLEETEEVSAK